MSVNPMVLVKPLCELLWQAETAIMEAYSANFEVQYKPDESPLTVADLASHKILAKGLEQLTPDVPVLSEEGVVPPWSERQQWSEYWLIDPLDGTQQFVARNGEFTTNVALIRDHIPVLGLVGVPAKSQIYIGYPQQRLCQRLARSGEVIDLSCATMNDVIAGVRPAVVLVSRSHLNKRFQQFLKDLQDDLSGFETQTIGSALKFCLLAQGDADFYPRLMPTSEWDTAAAQAVLVAAGGEVFTTHGETLGYNTKDDLLNAEFAACADSTFGWRDIFMQNALNAGR